MSDLRRLKDLFSLKRISRSSIAQLEDGELDEALTFLAPPFMPPEPRLLPIGAKRSLYLEARSLLGIEGDVPDRIDAAGGGLAGGSSLILLSADQRNADVLSVEHLALLPLIQAIDLELLAFTVHEAVVGRVEVERGDRFVLSVELDTPARSVASLSALVASIEEVSPSDPASVRSVAQAAVKLRRRLGALARYPKSAPRRVSVQVRDLVERSGDGLTFFFFDDVGARQGAITSGDNPAEAISLLIEMDLIEPDLEVARRVSGHVKSGPLQKALGDAVGALAGCAEKDRRWLLRDLSPSVAALVARPCPRPLIKTLWARVSPIRFARLYHHPQALVEWVKGASDEEHTRLRSALGSLIIPSFGRCPGSDHVLRTALRT